MRMPRGIAPLAVAAASMAAAPTASAATHTATADLAGGPIVQVVRAQNLGNANGTSSANYSLECAASAPGAISITLKACYLQGQNDGIIRSSPSASTGSAVAGVDVAVFLNLPVQPYKACIQARAVFADASVGEGPLSCVDG